MKLSNREKNLIVIAGTLLVVFIVLRFLIQPQMQKIQGLKEELEIKTLSSEEVKLLVASRDTVKSQIEEKEKTIAQMKEKYYAQLAQEEIIWTINTSAENVNLQLESLSFQNLEVNESTPYRSLQVKVPFKGDYNGIMGFLANLRRNGKHIILENMLLKNQENGLLAGEFLLGFYSASEDMSKSSFQGKVSEKNKNPFQPFGEGTDSALVEEPPADFDINQVAISITDSFILYDGFEAADYPVVSSDREAQFKVTNDENDKDASSCILVDYNFLAESYLRKFEIGFDKKNITIKKPPKAVTVDMKVYGATEMSFAIKAIGADNRIYNLPLTGNGQSDEWASYSANMPQNFRVYPLKIQSLEVTLYENAFGSGQLVLDNLKGSVAPAKIKTRNAEKISGDYLSYVVVGGDTLKSISLNYYGTENMAETIKRINNLKSNQLEKGKKLLLPVMKEKKVEVKPEKTNINGSTPSSVKWELPNPGY